MKGIKISHCDWTKITNIHRASVVPTDLKKMTDMFANFMSWMFSKFVVALIRVNLYRFILIYRLFRHFFM